MNAILLLLTALFAQAPKPLQTVLAHKKWERRVLLLYAASATNPDLQAQQQLLASVPEACRGRDLDVLLLIGPGPADYTYLTGPALRCPPNAPFAGWLIGKDGGVKTRFTRPIHPADLFKLIDSMPMRQTERRRQ